MTVTSIVSILPLFILAVTGFYFKSKPQKAINPMMGYRTKRSKQSQESWDFAQKYSSELIATWSSAGIVGMLIQIFISKSVNELTPIITSVALIVLILIGTLYYTEKELKKRF